MMTYQNGKVRTMIPDDDPVLRLNKRLIFVIVIGMTMWYGIVWLMVKWFG